MVGLTTDYINRELKNCIYYKGAFPYDLLPNVFSRPAFFVVNTDPSTESGEHWVAIYIKANGKAEFFDSFGEEPTNLTIRTFLNTHGTSVKYNRIKLQNNFGVTCGNYCILYVKMRHFGYSLRQITTLFSKSNTFVNEEIIVKLYKAIQPKLSNNYGKRLLFHRRSRLCEKRRVHHPRISYCLG